jgi:hypothetical protein
VVAAIQEQVAQLIHVPNTWYMEAQGRFAELLSTHSFGKAFFCNSGAEAVEAAISYVRAWGRAAVAAGYVPHIFCVSSETRVECMPYGTVHSARSPVRPFRGVMLAAHGPYIVRAIEAFAANHRGRLLIHSFGCWGGVGLEAARCVARRGIECRTVVSPFTTAMHEGRGKLRGAASAYGLRTTLQLVGELLRLRLTVVPSERRGLRGADLVLVNYESVRRIVAAAFGAAIRFERITYAPETAFLRHAEQVPMPDALRHLEPRDAPLILAVSSHNARKGLLVLLCALAQLRR